jgi:MFS family permease
VSDRLGPGFRLLWAAYAASTFGTWIAFDAFPLIAVLVLHSGPATVSMLKAAGLAIGTLVAVPLGPWVEFRHKRPVMIAADLVRLLILISIPVSYALGVLGLAQLLLAAAIGAAADIAFRAASGAYLKSIVPGGQLLAASGRLEATMWTATALGPPLGGLLIGLLGPVITVVIDALSYLLSALGIGAIRGAEEAPPARPESRLRPAELLEGWRALLAHPTLRPLFFNSLLVNGLIMATAPLLAVLMLGQLGFTPWQYGLAFGAPCAGGLLGARLARPLVTRCGQHRVLLAAGTVRAFWSLGLAFVQPGTTGLALVLAVQLGLVTSCGLFGPVLVAYRIGQIDKARIARTLSAWTISSNVAIAMMTALWGLLAAATGPRWAIAIAGVLMLATPLLLRRHDFSAPCAAQTPLIQS